jgi:diguanylate cyclase (GGDEF)-like protein
MQIRTKLALHLAVQVVLVTLMVAALLHLEAAYRALEREQSRRFDAHQLANELRQSVNESSLMARLYVLKPEPHYARYHAEIARMRDGLAPQRMRAAGLSAHEQALLGEVRQRSDVLMRLERQAMSLAEKRGTSPRPTEWREAVDLLHGEAYLRARAEIMAPIQALTRGLAERLDAERAEARRRASQAAWMMGATLLAFALHALVAAYRFERSVRRPLAALRNWAQEVRAGRHGSRTRLSLGNEFGELSAVIDEMADAVEHSLAELREEVQRRTRAEEFVQHLANHDALTGLPSLRLLHDRLERALARAQREEKGVAVLFIDLNGFKPVNDQYGHESGDMVLKVVGQRLAGAVRDADTVGRIGGDEFLVILPDVGSVEAAAQVRDKLDALVREPIYLPAHKLVVQVSAAMGIALYPEMAQDAAGLLRLADQDMYERKAASGAGRVAVPPIDVG